MAAKSRAAPAHGRLRRRSDSPSPLRSAARDSRLLHMFKVGPEGCRMLLICTPGATSSTSPPSDEPPDFEHIAAAARANGCELLL